MKHNILLTITNLLLILLITLHFTDDTLRARVGTAEAGGVTLVMMPILVIWLVGTLLLGERRSGYLIMLILSIAALGLPVLHVMAPAGFFHGTLARSSADYLFVWTLYALSVAGMFSIILSARGLWSLRSGH